MFKDKLFDTLKRTKNNEKDEKETLQAMAKIERQKRFSSEQFLKIYYALWKEDSSVKYQTQMHGIVICGETSNSP
jgi:hypothetical protein